MGPLLEPPAPHLRGLALAFSGIIREVWKGYWNWNYTLQKKGRDMYGGAIGSSNEPGIHYLPCSCCFFSHWLITIRAATLIKLIITLREIEATHCILWCWHARVKSLLVIFAALWKNSGLNVFPFVWNSFMLIQDTFCNCSCYCYCYCCCCWC